MDSKQQENIAVKNSQQLEQHWDSFSPAYTEAVSPNSSVLYLSMLNMLEIQNSDSILEVAVGSGHLTPYLLQTKKQNAEVYLTDLSTNFLAMTQKRLELFSENKQDDIYKIDFSNLDPFTKQVKIDKYNTYIQQANSENLTDFASNSIDSYISSLCLQLTTDPYKMIKEAFRVLRPGGKACFSVWGSKERTTQLSILPKILMQNGLKMSERSNFHLNDREKLIKMFESEGFSNVLCWDQFIPFNQITSEQKLDDFMNFVQTKNMIAMAPEDKQEKIKKEVREAYRQILKNQKTAIGLDALVILVQKP